MSMIACADCGRYFDTDDGLGSFEVPRKEYLCDQCLEEYLDEDGMIKETGKEP